jgi:type III secretion protein U
MSDEKTEPASAKKLEDARKKGQVPQSKDLASAFAFMFALAAMMATATSSLEHVRSIVSLSTTTKKQETDVQTLYSTLYAMLTDGLWIVGPILAAAVVGGLVGGLSHVGLNISFEPLAPKFDKLDPVAGLKKIISVRSLVEFLKTVIKAVVIGSVVYVLIKSALPSMLSTPYGSVSGIGQSAWSTIVHLLITCTIMFLIIGPIDFVIQRLMFMKDQKMSKDEVKREYKESEGDPLLKGERKALAQEIAFSNPAPAVSGANAVIVNPTHYAVAIRYRPEEFGLPLIVAKGVDESAAQIRALAQAASVPIIGNPALARALYKVDTNQAVPEELLEAVAIVLRWAQELRGQSI